MPGKLLPNRQHILPSLNHVKDQLYIDYPVVYNATVTLEPFYVELDFTFVTSDAANTTLYKWTGGGWYEITGLDNPDVLKARGFYAITTTTNAYCAVTEHLLT